MSDITSTEMAGIVRRMINRGFGLEIAEETQGESFEFTAPATGQRFRVTVAEISADDAVDAAISAATGRSRRA